MNCYEDKYFLGNWNFCNEKGALNIEKAGETYKCLWKIYRDNDSYEYLGIGMFIDGKLFVLRYLSKIPMAGIGMYKPIGDFRSKQ